MTARLSAALGTLRRAAFCAFVAVVFLGATAGTAHAQMSAPESQNEQRLQVTEPYLELHTGPGRGYPVFHVVERAQFVTIELRKTDWYRVRTDGGPGGSKTGWVQRGQLESTLAAAGAGKTFRDLLLDDYLRRRVEFGAGYGRFKGEPALKLWLQYRLADTVGVELTTGQVQGVFSGTEFWHLGLTSEPWSDKRWSPFFGVGVGKFRNVPNLSLVNATPVNANLAQATLGIRYHIGDRFVARLDWTLYTAFVSDERSSEYRSITAGIAFFF
jgi:hypothetical protein